MNKNNFIIIVILISGFMTGYFTMFFLDKSNIDYSENHVEKYKNVNVEYSPEFETITIFDKNDRIIYNVE